MVSFDAFSSSEEYFGTGFHDLPAELRDMIYSLSGNSADTPVQVCPNGVQIFSKDGVIISHATIGSNKKTPVVATTTTSPVIWVNRSSYLAAKGSNPTQAKGSSLGARLNAAECRAFAKCDVWCTAHTLVKQPTISLVSKQVRADVLPPFYGNNIFLFTLFEKARDVQTILGWLKRIGPDNAKMLRKIVVVYRKKQDGRYVNDTILPAMRKLGATMAEIEAKRFVTPGCYCEAHIMKTLHRVEVEGEVEEKMRVKHQRRALRVNGRNAAAM